MHSWNKKNENIKTPIFSFICFYFLTIAIFWNSNILLIVIQLNINIYIEKT